MGSKYTKAFLLIGALILFVLLFLAPKSPSPEEAKASNGRPETTVSENANLDFYVSLALKKVSADDKKQLDKNLSAGLFDSVASYWNKSKRPDLAAYYIEQSAKKSKAAADWFTAGSRYYYAVQFTQDKTEVPILYQSAIRSFKNGLKLDPNNVDGKIMLASAYVEGSEDPMKGVTLLREIEKVDSNNVKLQLTFAFFSLKSRQLDKAIVRFKKVLRLDPTYTEAYLHLADAYEQMGEKEETIKMLEEYVQRTTDMTARMEVKKYIQQLKESK